MKLNLFFRSIISKSNLKEIGCVIQRNSINKDGVNMRGKFGLGSSNSFIFKEGYNGKEWGKVNDNKKLQKLLSCEGIINIKKMNGKICCFNNQQCEIMKLIFCLLAKIYIIYKTTIDTMFLPIAGNNFSETQCTLTNTAHLHRIPNGNID